MDTSKFSLAIKHSAASYPTKDPYYLSDTIFPFNFCDECTDYCYECASEIFDKVRLALRLSFLAVCDFRLMKAWNEITEEWWEYENCLGDVGPTRNQWQESDSPAWCEACGVLLNVAAIGEDEIDYWRNLDRRFLNTYDCAVLECCIEQFEAQYPKEFQCFVDQHIILDSKPWGYLVSRLLDLETNIELQWRKIWWFWFVGLRQRALQSKR